MKFSSANSLKGMLQMLSITISVKIKISHAHREQPFFNTWYSCAGLRNGQIANG